MLREFRADRRSGEPARKWFGDDNFDLIVWIADDGSIWGFQLCYDVGRTERAVTWMADRGYSHHRVDDGEPTPFKNLTPILVPDGTLPVEELEQRFARRAASLDPVMRDFIVEKLHGFQAANDPLP